jgi:uncharacterized repeat protein (TIGR01451 family)
MNRRSMGISRLAPVICAIAMAACAGARDAGEEATEQRAQALSIPPRLVVDTGPPAALVSVPLTLIAHMANGDRANLTDVTISLAVSGNFNSSSFSAAGAAPFPCTLTGAAPGPVTVSCHADAIVSFGDLHFTVIPTTPGPIDINASVQVAGVQVASASRRVVVSVADGADLAISGFADGFAFVGQSARASFFGGNAGPLDGTGVHVTFQLNGPAAFTSIESSSFAAPMTCTLAATSIDCTLDGALQPRVSSIRLDAFFVPTGVGTSSITAAIAGAERDPTPFNNATTTFTTAFQPVYADLAISMASAPPSVVGRPLDYTITVTNRGPDAASSAVVDDPFPPGMTFVSAAPSQGSCFGGEWGFLSCDLGGVPAGAAATIALTVIPTAAATATNTASVSDRAFGDIDPNFDNNTAFTTVTVHGRTSPTDHPPPTRGGCGLWPGAPIDDVEDGNAMLSLGSKQFGSWFVTSDGTGSQTPSSLDGLVVRGGPGPSKFMVQSSGFGFGIWGAALGIAWGCPYDVSRFRGVRFAVKAGGQHHFFIEIPTVELQGVENNGQCTAGCSDFYRQSITLPDDGWYQCTAAFADLSQAGWGMRAPFDIGGVMGAQFNIEVPDAPYDLSLDDVRFVASPNLRSGCIRIGP